jgi:hypothetical protein
MAFAYTVTSREWISRKKRICWGTFTNGTTDTGGDVVTGMKTIDHFCCSINSHVGATVNKTVVSGGTATLTINDGVDGTWMAIGT